MRESTELVVIGSYVALGLLIHSFLMVAAGLPSMTAEAAWHYEHNPASFVLGGMFFHLVLSLCLITIPAYLFGKRRR